MTVYVPGVSFILNYDIYFSDPFGEPAPRDIMESLSKWIQPTGNVEECWEFAKSASGNFLRQTNVFADLLAVVAIERKVKRSAK
jgi:hypothetical protein